MGARLQLLLLISLPLAGPAAVGAEPTFTLVAGHALASDALTPPPDHANWEPTSLPDRWGQTRLEHTRQVWYRLQLNLPQPPDEPWAAYVARVNMNAEVWLNGVLVGAHGRMVEPVTRHWNTPLIFRAPAPSWRAGRNTLHVRVVAYADGKGGLSPVRLGPATALEKIEARQRVWRIDLVYAANIVVIALGLFVFGVWLRHRQTMSYGYFSAGAVLWGLSNFNMTVREAPLAYAEWERLVFMLIVWSLTLLGLFGLRFSGRQRAWVEWVAVLYMTGYAIFLWVGDPTDAVRTAVIWLLPVLLLGTWSLWAMVRFVQKAGAIDYTLFAAASLLTVVFGLHDWLAIADILAFDRPYALPFVAPVLIGALTWLIAGDYARSRQALAEINRDLVAHIARKEEELRISFEQLAQLQREQAVASERARILRDMHDGVGTHLTAAIRQLQGGQAPAAAVVDTLRDSLDQLKLSIDAMSCAEGDVSGLLGALRFRLEPRLVQAGLKLHWTVDDLPPWPAGKTEAMRDLQYIVFEALSNVLQHAGASTVHVRAGMAGDAMRIEIQDDGAGVGVQASPGHGVHGMQQRAMQMGARLALEPAVGGGCLVRVTLPMTPPGRDPTLSR